MLRIIAVTIIMVEDSFRMKINSFTINITTSLVANFGSNAPDFGLIHSLEERHNHDQNFNKWTVCELSPGDMRQTAKNGSNKLKELTLQTLSPIAGGRDRGKAIQFQLERVNRTLAERVIDAQ